MNKLTLTFLGVGSAFAKRNWHSNALLEAWHAGPESQPAPDETLLIDFGTTGPMALDALRRRSGFEYLTVDGRSNYPAIKNIIVTHQHADHVGGLEEFAAVNMHVFGGVATSGVPRPRLISTTTLLDSLWAHTLSGGLRALAGREAILEDYFIPCPLKHTRETNPQPLTLCDRFELVLVPTDHVRIHKPFDWPSFSLLITDRASGASVFYSSDTRFDSKLLDECAAPSRLVFHDVQLVDEPEPVHALLSELRALPDSLRRKMILFHYGDMWDEPAYSVVEREFAGFAAPHKRYLLFE